MKIVLLFGSNTGYWYTQNKKKKNTYIKGKLEYYKKKLNHCYLTCMHCTCTNITKYYIIQKYIQKKVLGIFKILRSILHFDWNFHKSSAHFKTLSTEAV